jgi:uncharacterized membrane protein YbhN (UPF0104 family)
MQNNKSILGFGTIRHKKIILVLKWLFLLLMLWYLYVTIEAKGQGFKDVWQLIKHNISMAHIIELCLVAALTPLNWACEALKWRTLAARVEQLSFVDAFKGVLAGLALGFLMPSNIGDAAGRVMSLQSHHKLKAIGAALLANGLQFYVSLVFGALGWLYLINFEPSLQRWYAYSLCFAMITALIFGLWLFKHRLATERYLAHFGWFRWLKPFVDVIVQYHSSEIIKALAWALLRYAVFSLQFWLLILVFDIKLPLSMALMGIFLVFFAKTILPALNFLGDLGIREGAALYFFGFFGVNPTAVVATTLTLWLVNILLPVLAGMVWILKLRWIK